MKRIYHVIINPVAGGGKGSEVAKKILSELTEHQFTYHTYQTEYPNHEAQLVQTLLEQNKLHGFPNDRPLGSEETFPMLLVIGGDGTLHHVVNQLHAYGANYPVAYIPAGTGNDFARALGLPDDPVEQFWQVVKTRLPKTLPLLSYQDQIQGDSQVFFNNLGIGLDGKIVRKTNESARKKWLSKWHLAHFSYLSSALVSLFEQKAFPSRIEINGQSIRMDKTYLCTITNHPYFGGGVAIAPTVSLEKAEFELVIVEKVAWFKLCYFAYHILRKKDFRSRSFHRYSAKKLRLVTTTPEETQIDGESIGTRCYDLTIQLTEQAFW
jgi:YegS/Rv2252/BmrU family lipid kinase